MRKIKIFDLNLADLILRFYLMMAVVVVAGFFGQFTIAAILGNILAISFILAVSFRKTTEEAVAKGEGHLRGRVYDGTVKEAA
ncbi:MAG: hypothetical protein IPN74_16045 [Haliscomenobacter sp.]|nr:hypothetical protein [Haliscomenobacter sp.]MBK8879989.1 hypothetical protein [Haliscomenobacter sp.]